MCLAVPRNARHARAVRGRRRGYYEPEDLGEEQDARDAAVAGRRYYVYVLETDRGHYVGHSARVRARAREHAEGRSASTAGANPELAWTSWPLETRADAARFEAAMKALRDRRAERFREITGLAPEPFAYPPRRRREPAAGTGGIAPVLRWAIPAAAALAFLLWLLERAS